MAQYDGSIKINTKIDSKNASAQLMTLENRIVKTADKIASLRSKMNSLKDAKIPTQEYAKLQSQFDAAIKKYEELDDQVKTFQKIGMDTKSDFFRKAQDEAQELYMKIEDIRGAMFDLEKSGKAFTLGGSTEEFTKLGQQLQYAENDLAALTQRQSELRAKSEETESSYVRLGDAVKMALSTIGKGLVDIPFALVRKGVDGLKSAFSGLGNIAKKSISLIGSGVKKLASSMINLAKGTNKASGSFNGGLKSILKYGLGIRSLYALVNKLRTAIKEGFSNMANEVDGFKVKVDNLKASTLTLKNSLAAAFRPLVEIAIPYIQMVTDAMTNLLDTVGQFMAAITGQKSYTKAIKQTTAAIEDENKAQNKQLNGLDKLNNLSSGSGANDDASTQMFEENVPISDKFSDIAQQFKDMLADADFTELGAVIGGKIKSALENIPWNSIKQTVSKAGKSFATLINGFVEVPGLALDIGKTIGEAINTGIGGINSFLDNTKWDSVGKFISDGLNGIVSSVNWQGIGHFFAAKINAIFETISNVAKTFNWSNLGTSLSNGLVTFVNDLDTSYIGASISETIKGLLDTAISFLENTDWKTLGNTVAQKIKDFVISIDWNGIADRVFKGIGAALGGLTAFLWGLIEDAWNSVVGWWNEVAFEDGQFTMKGLLNGIWEGIKNIGAWIVEHIFNPFIEGFKKAFGIHSPSTVMEEQGNFIMQGLLNGISSLVDSVKAIWENMKKTAVTVWNSVKTSVSSIISNIKSVISTALNIIKATWTMAWTGMKNTVISIFNGIWSGIKGVINKILSGIESMANGVVNGINTVISALNGLSFDVPKWIPGIGGETFGFNIPELSNVSIPRLATGAVIPANREFLAVLGDQKHGTNIEAPLEMIVDAMKIALSNIGFSENSGGGKVRLEIPIYLDKREVGRGMQEYDREIFLTRGRGAFEH